MMYKYWRHELHKIDVENSNNQRAHRYIYKHTVEQQRDDEMLDT